MEKYVISMYDKGQNEAGPKAKVDAEDFLATAGFKKLNFYFSGARKAKLMSYKQSFWDIPRQIKKLEAQTVVFQECEFITGIVMEYFSTGCIPFVRYIVLRHPHFFCIQYGC